MGLPLNAWYARLRPRPTTPSVLKRFAVEDFGYVQHLNHFYDIDLIKTSPRILPVSIQSCIPQLSYGPFKLFSPRKGTITTFNLKASLKGLYGDLSGTDCFLPCDLDARHRSGAEPTQPSQEAVRGWPHAPGAPSGWTQNTAGVRPARGTRVHGSSCRTFCRRNSRSTSITFPGEPRAMTRALGRVQGPRYRAARARA